MRFVYLLLLSILCSFHYAFAQHNGKIIGQVQSEKGSVEQVTPTISLLQLKDSSLIQQTVTGKDGSFVFNNIAIGKYKLMVTAVGYQKFHSLPFELTHSKTEIQLPIFKLVPVSKALTGVTVMAKRPMVEQKIDRTIVNVEAAVTNTGATALEILEKAPGVTVDKDGNISLKGKEGVLVLVDGRPTQLGGADLANLLRNMNASQMDQVEIMTNPPARYDAAGNAGIINIKTKKSKAVGYNGSATIGYTQGKYPKLNEGFNFNYREGKINVFTNLSHNYRKNFEKLTIQRSILDNNTGAVENHFNQEGDRVMTGNSYNAKVGLDFFANK
ncbi:MAG TPA: TonB-dependent receptor, partial [Flavisolibacter sp.]|nr:TonB-dependent receptor [Flavisolibacter sp.]